MSKNKMPIPWQNNIFDNYRKKYKIYSTYTDYSKKLTDLFLLIKCFYLFECFVKIEPFGFTTHILMSKNSI